MSTNTTVEDWQALTETIKELIPELGRKKLDPVRKKVSGFSSKAAMLGMQDLATAADEFDKFLVQVISPLWNEEAMATLSFAMGALLEKMQTQEYGEAFSAGLNEVLVYLNFYTQGQAQTEPVAGTDSKESVCAPVETGLVTHVSAETVPVSSETGTSSGICQRSEGIMVSRELHDNPAIQDQTLLPDSEPISCRSETCSSPYGSLSHVGRITDAVQWYREILKEDPSSQVSFRLADELCRRDRWQEAVAICKQGLVFHPFHLAGRVTLGRALFETGQVEEAESTLMLVRDEFAKNSILYGVLAQIAESRGNFDEAEYLRRLHESLSSGYTLQKPEEDIPHSETDSDTETTQVEEANLLTVTEPVLSVEVTDKDTSAAEASNPEPQKDPYLETLSLLLERLEKEPEKPAGTYGLFTDEDRKFLSNILRLVATGLPNQVNKN